VAWSCLGYAKTPTKTGAAAPRCPLLPHSRSLLSRGSLVRVQPGAPHFDCLGNRLSEPIGFRQTVRTRQNPSEFTWVAIRVGNHVGKMPKPWPVSCSCFCQAFFHGNRSQPPRPTKLNYFRNACCTIVQEVSKRLLLCRFREDLLAKLHTPKWKCVEVLFNI
jgi:hypothetical protein